MDRENYHRFAKTTTQTRPPDGTKLTAVAGPRPGETYPVRRVYTSLGKAEHCAVCLDNPLIGEQHAVIAYTGQEFILYDQGSLHGSWVNGQRVTKHILQPNDLLQID